MLVTIGCLIEKWAKAFADNHPEVTLLLKLSFFFVKSKMENSLNVKNILTLSDLQTALIILKLNPITRAKQMYFISSYSFWIVDSRIKFIQSFTYDVHGHTNDILVVFAFRTFNS
jgi:hypothetical protein